MQDLIIPVNNEALSRAFAAVLTPEQASLIGQAYTAIDKAMAFGFEKGKQAATATGYETGHMAGFEEGYKAADNDYDDGYCDGVSDARAHPEYADEVVAALCADEEYEAPTYDTIDDFAEAYCGDSGDETQTDAELFDTIVARGEQPEYSRDGERLY